MHTQKTENKTDSPSRTTSPKTFYLERPCHPLHPNQLLTVQKPHSKCAIYCRILAVHLQLVLETELGWTVVSWLSSCL